MKSIIITAGLPGVGKSYTAQLLKKTLSDISSEVYHIEQDFFELATLELEEASAEEKEKIVLKKKIAHHKKKIQEMLDYFRTNKILIVEHCLDLEETRDLFLKLEDHGITIIILEIECSPETAIKRILKEESEGMIPIDKSARIKQYKKMKENWKSIQHDKHYVLDSDKDIIPQIQEFFEKFDALIFKNEDNSTEESNELI